MIRNYLLTAWRSMRRRQLTTFINIAGLALGITCAIIIYLILDYAGSYNEFFSNKDRMYRIVSDIRSTHGSGGTPGVPPPMPDALRIDINGIDLLTFISSQSREVLIRTGDESTNVDYFQLDEGVAYTEPEFLRIFQPAMVSGSTELFSEPRKVIISKRLSNQWFAGTNAVGQIIQVNREDGFEVVAVMENPPENSDIPFEVLISYSTRKEAYLEETGWGSVSSDDQVYLLLKEGVSLEEVNAEFTDFIARHFPDDEPDTRRLKLQHVSDWHSDERYNNYSYRTVSDGSKISMALVAVFLIITACVNFVNLKTALALQRTREIGMRKVLGSGKRQLVFQFLGETFLTVLAATVLSLGMAELALLHLNTMLETSLHITFSWSFLLFLLLVTILVTLAAGFYPARVIAGYKPALAIKNVVSSSGRKEALLRKSLVTFQFFISQFFIIGTIVLISQMDYLDSMDLGFNTASVIHVPVPESENTTRHALKTSLKRVPGVEDVSLVSSTPASGSVSITDYDLGNGVEDLLTAIKVADEDYFNLYDIQLLAGEGLTESDTLNRLVVNEKWTSQSGFENPEDAVGTMVEIWGYEVPVTGVVKTFHTVSARDNLQPVVIMSGLGNARLAGIRLSPGNWQETIGLIEKEWKQLYPEYNFEYEFLDQYIGGFYESEQEMTQIFTIFSLVAIVIGMLGLFGLIAFSTERRLKEIGIRKVMGASVAQIFLMFSWEVVKLVGLAFLFAAPLAWYAMSRWLENYTYRIDMTGTVFLAGLGIALLISLLTISYRSWQVAFINPAATLRSEG